MKKQLTTFVIASLVTLVSLTPLNVNAAEDKIYTINSVTELKEEIASMDINSDDHDQNREKLLYDTDPKVLEEYQKEVSIEVSKKIEDLADETNLEINTENNSGMTKHETIQLEDGSVLEVIVSDVPVIEKTMMRASATYNYGSRSYSVKTRVKHILYPDGWTGLVTYYKIGKSGLTAESSSTVGTTGVFPLQISKSSKLTDKRAEKVGYDINAQGDYTLTWVGYNGIGLVSYDRTIISSVKLTKLTSTNATVSTSYKQYE